MLAEDHLIKKAEQVTIIVAEDDDDDFMLMQRAFKKLRISNSIERVTNGQELLDYLKYEGHYYQSHHKKPALILLDLNMPVMDGREALQKIKGDRKFKPIPVVILTTSGAEEDINVSHQLGANSYIRKPFDHSEFLGMLEILNQYWVQIVELPKLED